MKTIEVTDKAAKTIEALRDDSTDEREVINEQLCKAFAAVGNKIITGDNSLIPALCILSDYHDLIEDLSKEGE